MARKRNTHCKQDINAMLHRDGIKKEDVKLVVGTPMLTANRGWTTHGELHAGDFVFDLNGKPTRVIQVHEPSMSECYRLRFACGDEIVCSAENLWKTRVERHNPGVGSGRRKTQNRIQARRADEIYKTRFAEHGAERRANHSVPASPAIDFKRQDKQLPVEPYTLGAWLGDGSKSYAKIVSSHDDWPHVSAQIEREGYGVCLSSHYDSHSVYRLTGGLKEGLDELGVRIPCAQAKGKTWKHIPEEYLFASSQIRWDLLCGLMDTDGTATTQGQARFTNTNRNLIDSVEWLARSLGFRPTVQKKKDRPRRLPAWTVHFYAKHIRAPFYIPRKQERIVKYQAKRTSHIVWNTIRDIRPDASLRCRGLVVDSPSGILVGAHLIPTAATSSRSFL